MTCQPFNIDTQWRTPFLFAHSLAETSQVVPLYVLVKSGFPLATSWTQTRYLQHCKRTWYELSSHSSVGCLITSTNHCLAFCVQTLFLVMTYPCFLVEKKHPKLTMNEKRATCNMQLDLYFLHTYSLMMLMELVASSKWKSDLLDPCVDWCAERNLSNTMSSHNSTDFATPDYTCFYLCIPPSYLSSQKSTTIRCHHKTGKGSFPVDAFPRTTQVTHNHEFL